MCLARLAAILGLLAVPTLPAHAQCTDVRIAASDALAADWFGSSISVDGDWAAISAPNRFEFGSARGVVYLLERVAGDWIERERLQWPATNGSEYFGTSVALDGDRLAVGAPGAAGEGRVFLYQRQGGTWLHQDTLVGSATQPLDDFGFSVALSGGTLVVGSPRSNYVSFQFRGSVYVFRESAGTWVEEALLDPDPLHAGGRLGFAVTVEGDRLVAAAPRAVLGGIFAAGVQRVFERSGTTWTHTADLVTNDAGPFDQVGQGGLSLSGDTLAVTAWFASQNATPNFCCGPGYVYVFDESGGSWSQTVKLEAVDAVGGAYFGRSVALDGDRLAIGAYLDPDLGPEAGSLYVFERNAGSWAQALELYAPDGFARDQLGLAVALDGDELFGGAPDTLFGTNDPGTVVHFDLTAPSSILAQPSCYGDEGCPCGNGDDFGGCANSTGRGAQLRACGSTSVAADDLELRLERAPTSQFGLLFMGGGQPDRVFGDGRRCVGSGGVGLWRFPVRNTGPAGGFVEDGLVAHSQTHFGGSGVIGAGSTWHFQAWFRDPVGPDCDPDPDWNAGLWHVDALRVPKGHNLSNALTVTFAP